MVWIGFECADLADIAGINYTTLLRKICNDMHCVHFANQVGDSGSTTLVEYALYNASLLRYHII